MKSMERALEMGATVLIEDAPEIIDPGLDSILNKAIYTNDDNLKRIKYNERTFFWNDDFRLFITTKMPNPHFLPETCIKLTIVNFTVTFLGLEQQLLVEAVNNEAPAVEEKRVSLVLSIAQSKGALKELEDRILKDLSESNPDTILDNEELIATL